MTIRVVENVAIAKSMIKSKSFLEIVVPTYNRASILGSTLNELCAAVSSQSEWMSLRVIDNSSTDATPDVAKSLSERNLLLYQRNDTNIGLIGNIAKAINTSRAEWVWVFGDDDHILLHCLPTLIRTLQNLPHDVVFARGLAAKVTESGCLISNMVLTDIKPCPVTIYSPGIEIASHGSIHALAFISSLFVRPAFWDQEYHDSIYRHSDLYTFVFVLLRAAGKKRTADLNFHVVAATDRGDRSYYTQNMCVARLTEYTKFEKIIHSEVGRRKGRRLLKQGRKGILQLRIASSIKLIGNSEAYDLAGENPIAYLLSYDSPYRVDQTVVRLLACIAKIPGMKSCFKFVYDSVFEAQQRRKRQALKPSQHG